MIKQIRVSPVVDIDIEASPRVRQAQRAIESYKLSTTRATKTKMEVAQCPVAHRGGNPEDLEEDFTTPGVQGMLGCPFAKMANGQASALQNDPIAAEFHQDKTSTQSPPVEQRPGQCPIRFLDQHSPEEVAKYFENHKHEIPRSHAVCVRRYQGNEISARQLDAKYGNLVNMIQGLGVKHKAYLPERDHEEEKDHTPSHGVEKWAQTVSQDGVSLAEENGDSGEADEEPRLSHFEKPLREIRVGESPSRPWGISVPADKEPTPSALQEEDGVAHLKVQSTSSREARAATPNERTAEQSQRTTQQRRPSDLTENKDRQAQIVFNGPVFFGYSADDVASLLQKTNLGNRKPGGE